MFTSLDKNAQKRSVEDIWYIGVVIDNDDPEKLQRIKVRSHELHRGIPDEALPWAIKASSPGQGNTDKGVGTVCVPVIGAKVLFKEQDNSQYYPMYMAIPNTEDLQIQELIETDYPHVYAKIDRTGNLWWVNTEQDHIKVVHVSGTSVSIDGKGHVKVEVADKKVGPNATEQYQPGIDIDVIGNVDAKISGNTTIHTQGNTDIRSTGEITAYSSTHIDAAAPRIDLNTNGPKSAQNPKTPKSRDRPDENTIKGKTQY